MTKTIFDDYKAIFKAGYCLDNDTNVILEGHAGSYVYKYAFIEVKKCTNNTYPSISIFFSKK